MTTRFTLHVPIRDNDGQPFGPEVFQGIESRLLDIGGGGFSAWQGGGVWRNPDTGQVFAEPVVFYAIDAVEPEYVAEPLRDLASFLADALQQDAVYLTRQDIAAQLVTREVADVA